MKKRTRLCLLLAFVFFFAIFSVLVLILAINTSHRPRHGPRTFSKGGSKDAYDLINVKEKMAAVQTHILSTRRSEKFHRIDAIFGNSSAPRMALVIPFRARDEDEQVRLDEFIWFMHWFFSLRPQLGYRIVVIEQEKGKAFNRAKLLNVGFLVTKNQFDYYVFHDVDERPWSTVDYGIPRSGEPTHMMAARSRYNYAPVTMEKDPYYTGGVMKITKEDFIKANGFSNEFWGWGHEDRDFGYRMFKSNMTLHRLPPDLGRFKSTPEYKHGKRDKDFEQDNYDLVASGGTDVETDGITTTNYTLLATSHTAYHSQFLVSI